MGEASFRSKFYEASSAILINVAAGIVATPVWLFLVWLGSKFSPLFALLFTKIWSFLSYPISLPLGLLLIIGVFTLANSLVFVMVKKLGPQVPRVKATSYSTLVVIVAAVLSILIYSLWPTRPSPLPHLTKLTSEGNVFRGAISPDGKFFVYGVTHNGGRQSLRLGQVATLTSVQIADPEEARYENLTFSPDGSYLYFVKYDGNNLVGGLYQMAVLGGQIKKILSDRPRFFSFSLSPDGHLLAFVQHPPEGSDSALMIVNVYRANEVRTVALRKEPEQFIGVPAWSPDGKVIACAVGSTMKEGEVKITGLRADSGAEEFTTSPSWNFVGQISWLSNNNGLILSASKIYGPYQIWRIPYAGGKGERITDDLNNYDSMSLTADSSTLLTVQDDLTSDVWVKPVGQSSPSKLPGIGVGKHNDYWGFSWTPDGRILYESTAGGNQDIWVMKADGSNRKQLTASDGDNFDPCMTPDGRYIIFTSKRGESFNIWRVNADGGDPIKLSKGIRDFTPNCSPDGQWVVYTSDQGGEFTLWKARINGEMPVRLTDRPSQWPAVSPDGKQIACFYEDAQTKALKLAVIPFEGGPPVTQFDIPRTVSTWAEIRWTPDGHELTYIDTKDGVSNIWSQPLDGGAPKQLTQFQEDQIFRYEWSKDGALILSRGTVTRDLVLIKLTGD